MQPPSRVMVFKPPNPSWCLLLQPWSHQPRFCPLLLPNAELIPVQSPAPHLRASQPCNLRRCCRRRSWVTLRVSLQRGVSGFMSSTNPRGNPRETPGSQRPPPVNTWVTSPAFEPPVTSGMTSRGALAARPWHVQAAPTPCPLRTQIPHPIPDTLLSQVAQPPKGDPGLPSSWAGEFPCGTAPPALQRQTPHTSELVGSEVAAVARLTPQHRGAGSLRAP